MSRMLLLALLPRMVAGEDSSPDFVVESWRVVSWKLFPTGYTLPSGAIVREVSACRFRPRNQGDDEIAVLIGDGGELYEARITVDPFEVEFLSRVELGYPVNATTVDAEGAAFLGDQLYVSTEYHDEGDKMSTLSVTAYDLDGTPSEGPLLRPPGFFDHRVQNNLGFEALMTAPVAQTSMLISTTEGPLKGDADDARRIIGWTGGRDSDMFNDVEFRAKYDASWIDDKAMRVVDFESLGGDNFLSLERKYLGSEKGDVIRLFEVVFYDNTTTNLAGFEENPDDGTWDDETEVYATEKRLLFEWSDDTPLTDDESPPVDNYEGLCLMPHAVDDGYGNYTAHLILVNDDNDNESQIGTQFVLLEIIFSKTNFIPSIPDAFITRSHQHNDDDDDDDDKNNYDDAPERTKGNEWLWLLPILIFIIIAGALCSCRRPDTVVVDNAAASSDGDDDTGIELAYDVATKRGSKGRGGSKAKYSRVGNGYMIDNSHDEDDPDDDIDYV